MTGNNVNYKLTVTMVNELPKLGRQVALWTEENRGRG